MKTSDYMCVCMHVHLQIAYLLQSCVFLVPGYSHSTP